MNRRDFVRKGVGVVVAGSLIDGEERIAAQSSAQTGDKKALSPANWTLPAKRSEPISATTERFARSR
jgi:hypothetical protein